MIGMKPIAKFESVDTKGLFFFVDQIPQTSSYVVMMQNEGFPATEADDD